MEIRHEWRSVNGITLHCVTAGTGPLVVLLHGFPECWYSWRYQIPALAEHFTVVAPDMRGYNESDKPPRVRDYAVPLLVNDVAELVHSFGEQQAIIVGHDWGGIVAWATALTHPDLVAKLIILNAPHPRLFIQHLLTNPQQMLRSAYVGFFQLPWLPERTLSAHNYQAIERILKNSMVYPEQVSDKDIEFYKQAIARPKALTSALNYYRAGRGALYPALDVDPVVRVPVLVIWGEQDVALGKELNNGIERYAPSVKLRFIADASHWVQQDKPDAVAQHMLHFMLEQD